ncbi:MAG TPA: hypothetical protein VGG33_17575 [Polyangia bacterium]
MAEKVAKLGIARDKDFMFYVKDGSVWRVKRKQPGAPKGKPEQVADGGFTMDYSYIYFVDRDGDVSRAKRAVGGQKRKKPLRAKTARSKSSKSKSKAKPARKGTKRATARKTTKGTKRIGPKASKPRGTKSKAAARKKRT